MKCLIRALAILIVLASAKNLYAVEEFNPLEILSIYSDSSPEEVRAAYKRMAKRTHPDLNPQASGEEFLKVKKAFDLLKARNFDLSPWKRERPQAFNEPTLSLGELLQRNSRDASLLQLKEKALSYLNESMKGTQSGVEIFEDVLSHEPEIREASHGNLLVVEASLLAAFEFLKKIRKVDEAAYQKSYRQGLQFLESRARQAKNYAEEQWYESISFQVEASCADFLKGFHPKFGT